MITSLNFSTFASTGPLPNDRIPDDLSFVTSSIAPFSSNLHSQVLDCPSHPLVPQGKSDTRFVRWILNDGVVPISNMEGCEENDDGLCYLESYVASLQKWIESVDYEFDCCEFSESFVSCACLETWSKLNGSLDSFFQMAITPCLASPSSMGGHLAVPFASDALWV